MDYRKKSQLVSIVTLAETIFITIYNFEVYKKKYQNKKRLYYTNIFKIVLLYH